MKPTVSTDAEDRIRQAAKRIFLRRGLDGARMQDIANEAGVDKALVHYYYRSKDRLFALVFDEVAGGFLNQLRAVLTAEMPLFEKISRLVEQDNTMPDEYPLVALFIITEMNQSRHRENQPVLLKPLHDLQVLFVQQVETEIEAGTIRRVDPVQLFITLISLSLFPMVAKPLVQAILGFDDSEYMTMLNQRAQDLPDFINRALSR